MRNYITNKIFGLLMLLAFTTSTSFSQKNYSPGYIIKNSGDTLYGLIDYKHSDKNPDKLVFKSSSSESPTTYAPSEIIEFGLKKELYIKGIVKADSNDAKNDTVFLQTLFNGKKSLYYHKDPKGVERFYIRQGGKLEQLISKNYIPQQDGSIKIEKSKKYTEQLGLYLNDCSARRLNLKYTSYNKSGLINLFEYYYKCAPSYNYYHTRKITTEFGAFIGASLSSLEFTGKGYLGEEGEYPYDWFSSLSLGKSIKPSAGLFFNFILPWNQRKWSINNELMFSNYTLKGKYSGVIGPMQFYNLNFELGYAYLKLNNLVRYNQPIGPISIFVNGGISTGWAVVEKNTESFAHHYNGSVNYYKSYFIHDTRRKEHGFIIGSGIKFRKYSAEFRYEIADGMEVYRNFTSITKRYFILLGYTF